MKARLEAQAVWESAQSSERISRAVIIRKGLLMYFKENPLPEGFFKEYIEQIEDEKEREKLLKLLEKHSKFDDVVYRP